MKTASQVLACATMLALAAAARAETISVAPPAHDGFLRNPLMGFVTGIWDKNERYADCTLVRPYIRWNEIEDRESDGPKKIRAFCDKQWAGLAARNIKVVPRVYLHWSKDNEKYWPSDLQTGDYSSPRFQKRLVRLIERLGALWDRDPRVAWVQMGFIGKWGEHHSPDVTPGMQKLMGTAFKRAFPNKLVMVRHPWDFEGFGFGVHWDSFAHAERGWEAQAIAKTGALWKTAVMGGETAYDWGRFREQPGDSPDDTLSDAAHRDFLISNIRQLHCNHLGWVADYSRKKPEAVAGAREVQKAFGYRFVLSEVKFPDAVRAGEPLQVEFGVRNEGSTPFYYPWPVRVALLDAQTRRRVWTANFTTDIRAWMPGDFWSPYARKYLQPPRENRVRGSFVLPKLPPGQYFLALAICDPAGGRPAARFATRAYFNGGYHPVGRVHIGVRNPKEAAIVETSLFDDPEADASLSYDEAPTAAKQAAP